MKKKTLYWKETLPHETELFLGVVLLDNHFHKDEIRDYWSTNKLIKTPMFRKIMPR